MSRTEFGDIFNFIIDLIGRVVGFMLKFYIPNNEHRFWHGSVNLITLLHQTIHIYVDTFTHFDSVTWTILQVSN